MSSADLFHQLDSYDWNGDQEFQLGLNGILANAPTEQHNDLTLRARCFYFARKFAKDVDFDAYKAHQQASAQVSSAEPQPAEDDSDGPSLSYAELVELIQTGKPVPGIKDIPDTVLTGEGSTSVAAKRRKPWEKDGEDVVQDSSDSAPVDQPQVAASVGM